MGGDPTHFTGNPSPEPAGSDPGSGGHSSPGGDPSPGGHSSPGGNPGPGAYPNAGAHPGTRGDSPLPGFNRPVSVT